MQAGPAGFEAAIGERDALTVAAPSPGGNLGAANGWAREIEVIRSLDGELPDAASDVVGSVSAEMTVRGDAYAASAPRLLRASEAAAWLQSATSCAVGYDGLTVPVFAGLVNDLDASEESGDLVLTARDAADRLTKPVRLKPYGSNMDRRGREGRHPTNTSAVVTAILHENGIRVTPAPRSDACELYVPGVGGWLADIGWTYPQGAGVPVDGWLEPSRFAVAPKATGEQLRGFFKTRRNYGGSRSMFEAFVNVTSGMSRAVLSVLLEGSRFILRVTGGKVVVEATNGGGAVEIMSANVATGWRHLCFEVGGNYRRLWIDAAQVFASDTAWPITVSAQEINYVQWDAGGVQGVAAYWQPTTNTRPSAGYVAHSPEADVAQGALDVIGIPAVDGRESWDVLKEIAAAELGMVGFDESGRFAFRTRAMIADGLIPVATWDVDLVDDLHPSVSLDSVVTRATATVRPLRGVDAGLGAETEETAAQPSFMLSDLFSIEPGSSYLDLATGDPVLSYQQKVSIIQQQGGAYTAALGMAVCQDPGGLVRYEGMQLSAWIQPLDTRTIRVHFLNNSGQALFPVWPWDWTEAGGVSGPVPYNLSAGSPALWILGVQFGDYWDSPVTIDRTNAGAATWGDRVYAFPDSDWRQDVWTTRAFIDGFLSATGSPRATLAQVTVPADPRWQIGDLVRLTDWRGRQPGIVARITSSRLRISHEVENGMIGTYGLRQVAGSPPTIVTQPADGARNAGSTMTFTVATSGATSHRWQMQERPGVEWRDVGVGTSYTTPTLEPAHSERRYRCNAAGLFGDEWTREARVIMAAPGAPAVTQHPASTGAQVGSPVSISAAASGDPLPSLQWQRSNPPGSPFVDVPGATVSPLAFTADMSNAGNYRAVFTNSGGTAISNIALVDVYWD
ncbi:hypothetical protein BKA24_001695 [Microbacterium marinum]|uniref:Ig-like domain-containing protein n=1 Tax=Microbacterium marinum TaxID=421115 RepID=A0A7W7BQI3_9MICO|nr:immunoglobulin domain-containing protein [Microbacterium marinum]MBB4666986.1 hypothetical protein [Microbacterium marinum]